MPQEIRNSPNKEAGSILASSFVILVGALGAAIVIAAGGGDPLIILLIAGGAVVACLLLGWLMRLSSISPSDCYRWAFSRSARPEQDYIPHKRHHSSSEFGTNQPPTAEQLKQLQDETRTWVPSNSRGKSNRG